jgi:hypothetical protein
MGQDGMVKMVRNAALIALVPLALACGGSSSNVKAGPMPDGGNYTGVYFSPQYGEMHMVQNGSAVHGKYKKDERTGDIQGEADGNLLRFEWTEYKAMISNRPQKTVGRGYFHYIVDPSNGDHILKGRWGNGDDEADGGEWNAYKSRNREPDLESFGGGDGGGSGGEDDDLDDDSGSSDDDELF